MMRLIVAPVLRLALASCIVACGNAPSESNEAASNLVNETDATETRLLSEKMTTSIAADGERVFYDEAIGTRKWAIKSRDAASGEDEKKLWETPVGTRWVEEIVVVDDDLLLLTPHEDGLDRIWRLPKKGGEATIVFQSTSRQHALAGLGYEPTTKRTFTWTAQNLVTISADGKTTTTPLAGGCAKTWFDSTGILCFASTQRTTNELRYADVRAVSPEFHAVALPRAVEKGWVHLVAGRIVVAVDDPAAPEIAILDAATARTLDRGPGVAVDGFSVVFGHADGTTCVTDNHALQCRRGQRGEWAKTAWSSEDTIHLPRRMAFAATHAFMSGSRLGVFDLASAR